MQTMINRIGTNEIDNNYYTQNYMMYSSDKIYGPDKAAADYEQMVFNSAGKDVIFDKPINNPLSVPENRIALQELFASETDSEYRGMDNGSGIYNDSSEEYQPLLPGMEDSEEYQTVLPGSPESEEYQPVFAGSAEGEEYQPVLPGSGDGGEVQPQHIDDDVNCSCPTCQNRRFVDRSGDIGVSFKAAQRLNGASAILSIRAHEREHVAAENNKAFQQKNAILRQSVTIHMRNCPSCGSRYAAGGVTRTVTKLRADVAYKKAMKSVQRA